MLINARPRGVLYGAHTFAHPYRRLPQYQAQAQIEAYAQALSEMSSNDVNAQQGFRAMGQRGFESELWNDARLNNQENYPTYIAQEVYDGLQNSLSLVPRQPAIQNSMAIASTTMPRQQSINSRLTPMHQHFSYPDFSQDSLNGQISMCNSNTEWTNADASNNNMQLFRDNNFDNPQPMKLNPMPMIYDWTVQSSYHHQLTSNYASHPDHTSNMDIAWRYPKYSDHESHNYQDENFQSNDTLAGMSDLPSFDYLADELSPLESASSPVMLEEVDLPFGTVSPRSLTLRDSSRTVGLRSVVSSSRDSSDTISDTTSISSRSNSVAFVPQPPTQISGHATNGIKSRRRLPSEPPRPIHVPIPPKVPRKDWPHGRVYKTRLSVSKGSGQSIDNDNPGNSSQRVVASQSDKELDNSVKPSAQHIKPKTHVTADIALPDNGQPEQPELSSSSASNTPRLIDSNDELLIRCRKSGMTYKEIRKVGKFKEAESTLRGRHRTLTKEKNARVRKPEWKDNDICLLKAAVRKFGRKADGSRSSKVPWKMVAEYITNNGGSYHFGNATCRKRFDELQRYNEW